MHLVNFRQLSTAFRNFFIPQIKSRKYWQGFIEELKNTNIERVSIFAFIIAISNTIISLGLDFYYIIRGDMAKNIYLQYLFIIHIVISIIFFLLFLVSSNIRKSNNQTWNYLITWTFSILSIGLAVIISVTEQLIGGVASFYLIAICAILIMLYFTFIESLLLILLGNISYLVSLYFFQTDLVIFSGQVAYTFLFSFLFFLISRSHFKIKAAEYENYKEIKEQADELHFKNEKLKAVQSTLSSINKNLMQGLFRLDQKGNLVHVNKFLSDLFGFSSPEKMIKQWNLKHFFSDQEINEFISEIRANGFIKNKEIIYTRTDGSVFSGLINCSICSEEGNFFYDGSIVDNTERKNEQNLLEKLSLVASKTDNAVLIIDKEEKIEWVNEGFSRITGYSCEEAKGKKPGILLQGKNTDPDTIAKIGEKISKGQGFTGEMLNYRKDGSEFWVHMALNPIINDRNEIEKYVLVESDITERKKVEYELIKSKEEAEKLVKAKEEFLSMVSHELRTPLNAVIGMSHLLLQENPRKDQVQNLNSLKISAEYLLSLINDILDFSKIEAGKIIIDQTSFNFKEFVKAIEQTFYYQAQEKNIEFNILISDAIPKYLFGDPVRLNQILFNLLSNAIKFTDTGFVSLSVDVTEIDKSKATIKFTVKDSGVGIPEDKISSIFERFEQASNSKNGKRGGTGLGLAITKSLIELMNGNIQVKSEEGKGSEFSFTVELPFEEKQSVVKDQVKTLSNENFIHLNLLLVEDNKINQLVAAKFLKKWQIKFDVAENGIEATEKIKHDFYDIILMDIQMPQMDGYTATKLIREYNSHYSKIPIIALTAASLEVKEKVFQAGMNDFLIKPFNPIELQNKIRKYSDLSNHLDQVSCQNDLDISEMQKITSGDKDFLMELLNLCAEQFNQLPHKLKSAIKENDISEARNIMHKIKPSVKMLHYFELEKATYEFSKLLKSSGSDIDQIELKADELIKIIQNIENLILNKTEELYKILKTS